MSKKVWTTVPITYHPTERYWYRVSDWVQPRWHRFANSRTGFVVGRTLWVLGRVAYFLGGIIVIVGCTVLYTFLMFAFSGGKKGRR
jgi:hypothetical protein